MEELWAAECNPSEESFVSAGHDRAVIKWSAVSHLPVWTVNVEVVYLVLSCCTDSYQ